MERAQRRVVAWVKRRGLFPHGALLVAPAWALADHDVLEAGTGQAGAQVHVPQPGPAYREIRRILVPGGRVVLTNWEPREPGDERLPARLRHVDLRAGLAGAGFEDIEVRERPGWRDQERAMWEEAAALDPGDDPALCAFHEEGVQSPPVLELTRRVMGSATAP